LDEVFENVSLNIRKRKSAVLSKKH